MGRPAVGRKQKTGAKASIASTLEAQANLRWQISDSRSGKPATRAPARFPGRGREYRAARQLIHQAGDIEGLGHCQVHLPTCPSAYLPICPLPR